MDPRDVEYGVGRCMDALANVWMAVRVVDETNEPLSGLFVGEPREIVG
jgi:hypothetical protein